VKVLIVSSPTGGHLYPAMAAARELADMGHESVFVTRRGTSFTVLVRQELRGMPVRCIGLGGGPVPRRNPVALPFAVAGILGAVVESVQLIARERPRAILGTGGYSVVPVLAASRLFPRIPVILHEQNRTFGLANRFAAPFARRVCLGFPVPGRRPPKYVVTGNPLRRAFGVPYDRAAARRKFGLDPDLLTLLVFGGSQGACDLNTAVVEFLRSAGGMFGKSVQILHIAGRRDSGRVHAAYRELPVRSVVMPYCDEMHLAYTAADCAVCRAGAMTVTELLCTRTPAILVPYPYAAGLHQHFNAAYLAELGGARVVHQVGAWKRRLGGHIADIVQDPKILYTMRNAVSKVQQPARSLASAVVECI
jgi:UDP-N-acetylglucosamine--N-acetylmuramyl-(pentapeptide) pyrophosphoryl-undecaprenol N-acetylglucosamine transferase